MMKPKKHLTVALNIIFVFSLAFQLCCHHDWTDFLTHAHNQKQEVHHDKSHGHNDGEDTNSDCNRLQLTNFVKGDRLVASVTPGEQQAQLLAIPKATKVVPEIFKTFVGTLVKPPDIKRAGPAIYLLNSVFLN